MLLLVVSLTCASAATAARPVSIREFGAQELRLETIAYRLGTANAHACTSPQMMSGLVVHDLTQYGLQVRAAVSRAFSLHSGVGILEVVPGSSAEEAGLRSDDEILAVGETSVEDPYAAASAPQSFLRMDRFSAVMSKALKGGSTDLLVRRGASLLRLKLRGQPGCGGDAYLVNSQDLNAWSDGSRLFVSNALLQVAGNDDELAFVVAHEMAHNILGHSSHGDAHGLLGLFGFGASKIRREETQADLWAVPLVAQGGFQTSGAIQILARLRSLLWWDISLDHPGFSERIRRVSQAIGARLS